MSEAMGMRYNAANATMLKGTRRIDPTMSLNCSSGSIRFNRPAMALLGAKPGDTVEFYVDDDRQWHVRKAARGGMVLHKMSNESGTFTSAIIRDAILADLPEHDGTALRCRVVDDAVKVDGDKWHPVITRP